MTNEGLFQRDTKTAMLNVKLTANEKAWLQAMSAKQNLKMTDFVLTALRREYKRLSREGITDNGISELDKNDGDDAYSSDTADFDKFNSFNQFEMFNSV